MLLLIDLRGQNDLGDHFNREFVNSNPPYILGGAGRVGVDDLD